MNNEKLIKDRLRVFEKLITIGYDSDNKMINLKLEELLEQPNFTRSELIVAVGIKNALANKKLVAFLCGVEEKNKTNIRKEEVYE